MRSLNQEELEEIQNICNTWLVHKHDKVNSRKIDDFYNHIKTIDFSSVIRSFYDRLKTIKWKFTKSEEVSGSICFFGGAVTSILNFGYIKEIEGLFTFAVCYMLVDHFLDNETVSDEEKTKFIREIYQFILTGVKNDNLMVQAVGDRYLQLIDRVPESRKYFIKLFISELEGYHVQKKSDLKRDDYLRVAEEKGGFTSLCIASIIGLDIKNDDIKNDDSFNLGSLIQTPCDDILDIEDDRAAGIYTLVRYEIENRNLDRYLYESIKKIYNLSPVYNIFKIILLIGIILGIHDNPGCITIELNNIVKNYDIFEDTSKSKLIEWFHEKFSNYMLESIK